MALLKSKAGSKKSKMAGDLEPKTDDAGERRAMAMEQNAPSGRIAIEGISIDIEP